jgi:hypothetical protein
MSRQSVVDPAVRGIEFLLKIKAKGMQSNWKNLAEPQAPSKLSLPAATTAACKPRSTAP